MEYPEVGSTHAGTAWLTCCVIKSWGCCLSSLGRGQAACVQVKNKALCARGVTVSIETGKQIPEEEKNEKVGGGMILQLC